MEKEAVSDAVIKKLGKYDTPTICNVIEVFHVRPRNSGFMEKRIKACFPEMPPMVGYASTATYRSGEPPGKGENSSSIEKQVATFAAIPAPPVVVIQDLDSPTIAASFGEVMCTIYKAMGAVGLITSGAARDLDQVRALGFPAFSDGIICSHAYSRILSLQIPVQVGGLTVCPGDLLHGDCNGVTTIPNAIASEVADACDDYIAAENVILDYLKSGKANKEGLEEARRECVGLIKKLGETVQRER